MSHLSNDRISAALDGALTGPDSKEVLDHLASCVLCQEQQARYALHDSALRRLFQQPPDQQTLEGLTRGVIERIARFTPPEDAGPPTVQQETHATPADPGEPLPPAREPSRGMRTIGPEAPAPLEVAPRLDTERTTPPKPERGPGSLVESYDAFNDSAYAGPVMRESPPMLGRPQAKPEGNAEPPAPRKEYRHGGVRRDAPAPATEAPVRRHDRSQPAPRSDGFGVKREQEPAWARLGFQPDPSSPGVYRETLTGAAISPPPVSARRSGSRRSSSGRKALMATLVLVGGLAAVVLAMRIPTGAHLSVRLGGAKDSMPSASPGTIEVRSATTQPPVDVAVPQPSGGATTTEARLCGQVVDAKGRPVEGALLTVAATIKQTRTGADGRFCLDAPAGTQLVEVLDPRGTGTTAHQVRLSFVSGAPEARVVLP